MKELWARVLGNTEKIEQLEIENRQLEQRLEAIEDELSIQSYTEPEPESDPEAVPVVEDEEEASEPENEEPDEAEAPTEPPVLPPAEGV